MTLRVPKAIIKLAYIMYCDMVLVLFEDII